MNYLDIEAKCPFYDKTYSNNNIFTLLCGGKRIQFNGYRELADYCSGNCFGVEPCGCKMYRELIAKAEEKAERCFGERDKDGEKICTVLYTGHGNRCTGHEGCAFYKTADEVSAAAKKVRERLSSLPEAEKEHINIKYNKHIR